MDDDGEQPIEPGAAADAPPTQFDYVLRCPCGDALTGGSEDEIVELSFAHLREKHPDLADEYERHHILFMATKYRRRQDAPAES